MILTAIAIILKLLNVVVHQSYGVYIMLLHVASYNSLGGGPHVNFLDNSNFKKPSLCQPGTCIISRKGIITRSRLEYRILLMQAFINFSHQIHLEKQSVKVCTTKILCYAMVIGFDILSCMLLY